MPSRAEKKMLRHKILELMSKPNWQDDIEILAQIRRANAILTGDRYRDPVTDEPVGDAHEDVRLAVQVAREYESGMTMSDVANKHSIGVGKVSKLLDIAGIDHSRKIRRLTPSEEREIHDLYVKGMPVVALKSKYQATAERIRLTLDKTQAIAHREERVKTFEERICREYSEGSAISDLMAKYPEYSILKVLQRNGVKMRRRGAVKKQKNEKVTG